VIPLFGPGGTCPRRRLACEIRRCACWSYCALIGTSGTPVLGRVTARSGTGWLARTAAPSAGSALVRRRAPRRQRRHRPQDLDALVVRTLDEHGRIHVLINNAGQGFYSPVADTDLDLYRRILEINLLAPLAAMQKVLPSMRRRGRGSIINVSSGASLGVSPTTGAYSSTKAALNQLTAVARAELAPEGITVSLIHPYLTESEFNKALLGGDPISAPAVAPQHSAEHVASSIMDLIRSGDEVTVLRPA